MGPNDWRRYLVASVVVVVDYDDDDDHDYGVAWSEGGIVVSVIVVIDERR